MQLKEVKMAQKEDGLFNTAHFQNEACVETSSVVYSISRRILKHEHAQKHPSHPAPPPSHLAGLHAGEGHFQMAWNLFPIPMFRFYGDARHAT